jgi:hypothetical protein
MGFAEDAAAMRAAMSQTDDQRDTAMLRRLKQHRVRVIESIEGLTAGLKRHRESRARYLAENGIDVEELQRLRAACGELSRELRWLS